MKNKIVSRVKVGYVGEAILACIALVGVVSLFALFPGMAYVIGPFLKKKKQIEKQSVIKSVESLVRSGLVRKCVDAQGDVRLELTKRGKWEALLRNSHGEQENRKTKWDGVWRVIIFDVPVAKQKIRDELRRSMSLYGFKKLQQSVWVYPFPCDEFIEILKKYLGVTNDALYMKVGYIENSRWLQKEFNL